MNSSVQEPSGTDIENRRVFEEGPRWEHEPDEMQKERIAFTLSLLPPEAKTVLDVGCGRGDVLSRLNGKVLAFGCDLSHRGLMHVGGKVALARAEHLPFRNASFDLVLCSEVLEHLTEDHMLEVCREMIRVARHYIVITVPNREDLLFMMIKCRNCRKSYHAYGHLRSFTCESLRNLLPQLAVRRILHSGHHIRRPGPGWIKLRTNVLGIHAFQPDAVCPHCGQRALEAELPERILRKMIHALGRVTGGAGNHGGWLGAVYEVRK